MHKFAIAFFMTLAAVAAYLMVPRSNHSTPVTTYELQSMIPKQLDNWVASDKVNIVLPAPEGGIASKIYSQTLARGYLNKDGKLIMLVIAYGSNQTDSLQLHLPQICYTAIGYLVSKPNHVTLETASLKFPAVQLRTSRDTRYEPVTYWTRVGDDIPNGTWARQKTKLFYGLSGKTPDGVLVRISSIGEDATEEFKLQNNFITALLAHSGSKTNKFLLGKYAEKSAL